MMTSITALHQMTLTVIRANRYLTHSSSENQVGLINVKNSLYVIHVIQYILNGCPRLQLPQISIKYFDDDFISELLQNLSDHQGLLGMNV